VIAGIELDNDSAAANVSKMAKEGKILVSYKDDLL
jgi:hypothetical protein